MRLGEASGAAVALLVLRAALACHIGMATFDEAHVAKQSAATPEKAVSNRPD
jgi:nicotinate-nucleotide--dimethylbenzimidazole phosphoribosyltransferase